MEADNLKDFLLSSRLVSEDDFNLAVQEAEERKQEIEEVLLNKGFLLEDDWRLAKAHILGIPFVDLTGKILPIDTLSLIPEPISRRHNLVVYSKKGDNLEVALLDLRDLEAIDFLAGDFKILPRLTDSQSIKKALCQYQKNLKILFGDLLKREISALENGSEPLDLIAGRIVELLLSQALRQRATAVFFEPVAGEIIVRYRVNGHSYEAMILPLKLLPLLASKFKEVGDFKFDQVGQEINCRVSLVPTTQGERISLRLLSGPKFGPAFEDFNLSEAMVDKIYEALNLHSGLIIVTDSIQGDLSLFLCSLLDILNQPDRNIFTVERSISRQILGINQVPIRSELGQTPAKVLRRVLAQDPDVIVFDEQPERDALVMAVTAALAGKLIIIPFTGSSPADVLEKLINFGLDQNQIDRAVKLVIS